MKSSDYWQNRFKAIENMNHNTAKKAVQSVTPAFDKAQRQIEGEINAWYQRYAQNNQITLQEAKIQLNAKELKELKWDINDYIKYGRENAVDQRWMKELENASAKYHITRLEALKIRTQNAAELAFGNEQDALDQLAARIYTDDYYHTAFEIQKGLGIGWDIGTIDQTKLDKLLKKPWTTDKLTFSDRIWKSKVQLVDSLSTELTQMCILGKAPDQAIANIAKRMNVSKNQAGRLIMTESAYFASQAQKDCFNDLDVQMYEIVATLDSHTSDICQQMDGKHFDMKDYQAGVTAPPFHVWCRSTTVPYFDDEWDREGTRAARDENGKTYQVPADMKYPEWKEKFVDGRLEESIANSGIHGIISTTEMFSKKPDGSFSPISQKRFDELTIEARKHGATIIRGTDDVEKHLLEMGASASTVGDMLLFKKDCSLIDVIEETHHFMQNINHLNDGVGEPLRTILNEIEAKQFIIKNSKKYNVPRDQLDHIKKQLESYEKELQRISR